MDMLETTTFSAILSDVRMPVMNGVELYDWVKAHRPELASRMILTTGDASGSDLNNALESRGCRILRKPFSLETLLSCVRDVIPPGTPAVGRFAELLTHRRPVLSMNSGRDGRRQNVERTDVAV
jgi:CheY-like chemotaxis protein